jgi:putative membrane protein
MIDTTIAKVLVLSLPLGLLACSRDKPAESPTSYEDGPESGLTPASGSVSEERAASASELGANSTESLSDAQIAAIAGAINESEVEQAKIAIDETKNDAVKRFAETMIEHHSQAVKDVDELETRVGLEPADSRLLAQLRVEAKATEDKLDDTEDASFDKLYMTAQVDMHRKALDTLDGKLIPQARNAELKQLLQTLRPRIASHLEMARAILNTLP